MPELSTAPADASVAGTEKLLTLNFESVTVQQVADANESKSTNIASASTTDIAAATTPYVHVTGTTTISALGTIQAGARRRVVFDGALTLTHNSTSLILPSGANLTTAAGDVAVFVSEGGGNWRCVAYTRASGAPIIAGAGPTPICVACSDESTAITTGLAKVTFRTPYAFTVTGVKASLTVAQATSGAGGLVTIDINESGVSILSTKITIDNTEKSSATAAIPAVTSDSSLASDAEITIDVDQVGDGTAKGLKVWILGYPT